MRLAPLLVIASLCAGCADEGEGQVQSFGSGFIIPWWVLGVVVALAVAAVLIRRQRRKW